MWTPRNLKLSPLSPIVHKRLLGFTDIEGEVVVLAPHCQVSDLHLVDCLIAIGDQAYHCRVVSELDDGVGGVRGHAVEYRRGHSTHPCGAPVLRISVTDVLLPTLTTWACQDVQDPVAEGVIQSQFGDELGW